jgi:hypothetical protein
MDKQSKLIFESYQSIAGLVDLINFNRERSLTSPNTCFDVFTFQDKHNKKRYSLHQIVLNEDNRGPEIFGSSIFDNARDTDIDAMIFHSIDKNVQLHALGDLSKDSTIKNHKFFDEDKLGWEKVREMIHKAFAMTEKQRRITEYGMKPDTEDKFKDILSNLGESVQNDRFKLLRVKIKDKDMYVYDVNDNVDNCTYRIYTVVYGEMAEESEIYLLEPHLKGSGTHGQMRHSGETLLAITYGMNFESELRQKRNRIGKDLRELGKFLTNNITLDVLKRHLFVKKLKPKTQEHFGDILINLGEEVQSERFKILKVKIGKNFKSGWDNFIYEVVDKKNGSIYRISSENYNYGSIEIRLSPFGADQLLATVMYGEVAEDLKTIPIYKNNRYLKEVKSLFALGKFLDSISINKLKQIYFAQNLQPKTQEHFGDIMVGLRESIKAVPAAKFPKVEIMSLWRDQDEYHQGTDEILMKVGDRHYLTREFYEEMPDVLVGIYYFADPKLHKQPDGTYKIKHEGDNVFELMGDREHLAKWNWRARMDVIHVQGGDSTTYDVVSINDFLLKFTERERRVYMLKIKPNTAEHFGDIMGGLS